MKKQKVEIVDIKLDVDLEAEIKKQASIDPTAKSRAESIVERAKARQEASQAKQKAKLPEFPSTFGAFFDALMPKDGVTPEITKEEAIKLLGVVPEAMGATLGKFKRYLRSEKNNEWVILIGKNKANDRVYFVRPFNEPQ